jgi:hypothetical protein
MYGLHFQVIVSIATIPSRIGKIRPTLQSLLEGDLVPDQILVVRPEFCVLENSGYDLPDFLLDPGFCGGIIKPVVSIADFGPSTKLLGALDYLPSECVLILADDDVIYREYFVFRLVNWQAKCIKSSFSFYTYRTGGLTVGQGCDGFSFWTPNLSGIRRFAERHVVGTSLLYHDDLWISFYLATRGVRIKRLKPLTVDGLIYEQLLQNNVLTAQRGSLARGVIRNTHLPRLHREASLPLGHKLLLKAIGTYDWICEFVNRASRKLANLSRKTILSLFSCR